MCRREKQFEDIDSIQLSKDKVQCMALSVTVKKKSKDSFTYLM
jgi:hypothetical protein